jgi:SAM-dependent methyltransferase
MEVIRRRQPRLDQNGQTIVRPPDLTLKSFGGRPLPLENARLYLVLLGAGEALLGASLYVAVQFAHRLTFYATALAGSFAVAGGIYLALAFVSVWNNTLQKPKLARGLIGGIELAGTEVFADIDCGSGMVAREAAAMLDGGLAVVTIPKRLSGNPWSNSNHGADRTKGLVVADPRALPIRDGALDYAASGFGVRRFKSIGDRAFVLEEMVRTVKPGGSVAVLVRGDPFEASVLFQDKGMVDVETTKAKGFAPRPANVVIARKLFSMGGVYELGEIEEPVGVATGVEYNYTPMAITVNN